MLPLMPSRTNLRALPHCELPDENGNPNCNRPARTVIRIVGKHTEEPVAVCEECAAYVEREARRNAGRDR